MIVSFCSGRDIQDPTKVPLPENGSKPIPQLPKLGGFSCSHCEYLSIDYSSIRHHGSQQKHDKRLGDKVWRHVSLQRFVKGRDARYWIVE
ncbi:Uncharacterized protein HZ326_27412 [Fusarium oxysporum f. sp. albedinis]|nr:Uncharacterized protein HZ326_27412 [Fusarium oxysporum f. sp. albedinis]